MRTTLAKVLIAAAGAVVLFAGMVAQGAPNRPNIVLILSDDQAWTDYGFMGQWFDQTCGDLLEHLNRKQIADNTLVIYICDNGWAAASSNTDDPNQESWKGYALRSKSSPYENGIRSPIMISWPGHVDPARAPEFAHAIDLFPTIAAAAGLQVPEHLTGINLLDQQVRRDRKIVFGVCNSVHNMTPGNPDGTLQYLWCIQGDWKLTVRYPGSDTTRYKVLHQWDPEPVHLFNLKDDPHETNDLAKAHPEIAEKLRTKIEAWHGVQP